MGPFSNDALYKLFYIIFYLSLFLVCILLSSNNEKEEKNKKDEDRSKNKEQGEELINIKNDNDEKDISSMINEIEKYNYDDECIIYLNRNIMFGITFLGRIIITLYSFHGLIFLYNIIIQYLTYIPLLFYNIGDFFSKIFYSALYIISSLFFSNIMVIPSFEFLSFPFINFNNPLSHLYSFNYIIKNKKFDSKKMVDKNDMCLNFCLLIVEVLYFFGFILGISSITISIKDFIEFFLLCIIYLYYLMIFICYYLLSLKIVFKSLSGFDLSDKNLPKINLLSYSINPIFKDNYEKYDDEFEEKFCDIRNIIRIILVLIWILIISSNENETLKVKFIILMILILIVFPISIAFNFPFCYKNEKHYYKKFLSSNNKLKEDENTKLGHPVIVSTIRFISNLVFLLISIILCFALFINEKNDDDFTDFEDLSNFIENKQNKNNTLLLPNICNSNIYGIPIYLYIPFINDAYYFNDAKNSSSFDYDSYKYRFFDKNEYEIKVIGNLINNKENNEKVKMIQYNVFLKKHDFNVTILSIKGTTNKKDIYLDLQLYLPSVFLNLLSIFSIFGTDFQSNSFKLVEYSLSIPYRSLSNFLFINNYIDDLHKAYDNNTSTFYNNVVIVGHSLGGG